MKRFLLFVTLLQLSGCSSPPPNSESTSTTTQVSVASSSPAPVDTANSPTSSATPEASATPGAKPTPAPKPLGPAVKTKSGLKYEVFKKGKGEIAKNNQKVYVHYTGVLENGTKFDSSLDRGEPIDFILGTGAVIKGWDEGVAGMKVGEKRKLTIPPDLAYGEAGAGGLIPPGATLIFDVELVKVEAP